VACGPKPCLESRVYVCMTKTARVGVLAFLGASFIVSSASADPTKADDRYGYVFNDDILAADGSVVTAVPIRVQAHLRRAVLLRPRVQFVTEMLKSVEAL
jgi:hypothetical protein